MEISDKWFAIVNPVAGSGKGLTDWPTISKMLRDHHIVPEYVFTEHKYHAIELTVEAVNNGFRKIIVVGGDGTIHEVVNGLFIQKTVPTTDVLLSVIAVGTVNDWIRMFVKRPFEDVPAPLGDEIIAEAVEALRPDMLHGDTWYVDYVRLRMRAVKHAG